MLPIILVTCLYIILMFLTSLYCRVRKNNSNIRKNSIYSDGNNMLADQKISNTHGILYMTIKKYMDDFIFLYFKVVGYIPSHHIRNFHYKNIFKMSISEKCVIYYGLEAREPWNITLGKGTIIGDHAILDARFGIEMEENVNLSSGVWIYTLQHDINSPTFDTAGKGGKVVLRRRVWVSARTVILPKVEIAEGCVVAAGAVVSKSFDMPFCVLAGIPAKQISIRNRNLEYNFSGESYRHFL